MSSVLLAGLLAGWAVAVPVGPVGAYVVALAARDGWRTGAGAALGVAAVDGSYALLAGLGGSALADLVRPVAALLRLVCVGVLLALAVAVAGSALREQGRPAARGTAVAGRGSLRPRRAFGRLLALTAVNPTTLLAFAALVVGSGGAVTPDARSALVFAGAATVASAAWQLLLAGSGAALGAALTGPRGRLLTALVSSAVMAGLAIGLVVAAPG